MPDITIEGLDETLSALDEMKLDLIQKALQPALVAASVPVIETLATKTPVLTGDLLKHLNLEVKVSQSEKGGVARIGFPGIQQLVRWLEYGHREVGHAPQHKDEGKVQPHPFMRLSEEQSATAAVEAFKVSIDAFVEAENAKVDKAGKP